MTLKDIIFIAYEDELHPPVKTQLYGNTCILNFACTYYVPLHTWNCFINGWKPSIRQHYPLSLMQYMYKNISFLVNAVPFKRIVFHSKLSMISYFLRQGYSRDLMQYKDLSSYVNNALIIIYFIIIGQQCTYHCLLC